MKHLLSLLPILVCLGAIGCAYMPPPPGSVTGTVHVGGGGSGFSLGTFLHDVTGDIRRSMGPELTYVTSNGGVPPVMPYMRIHQLPDRDETWFYLNCQCEDPEVQITAGRENIGYDYDGDRFWIRNTHKGGDPRLVLVRVFCPGKQHPWVLPYYVQSSGPNIRGR
jgi:hypothetical protein